MNLKSKNIMGMAMGILPIIVYAIIGIVSSICKTRTAKVVKVLRKK